MLWFDVTPNLALLIVGFQSGVLRCFDKAGNVLLSQHLHRGAISSLKTNPSVGLQRAFAADLFVAFADCVLHIEGNSIFDSLTKPRQSSSSSSHRGGGIVRDDYDAASTTAWRFHKYQLQGQGSVLDVVPIAHPSAPLAAAPLSSACFLAVGAAPMLAVYPVAAGADSAFAFTSGSVPSVCEELSQIAQPYAPSVSNIAIIAKVNQGVSRRLSFGRNNVKIVF